MTPYRSPFSPGFIPPAADALAAALQALAHPVRLRILALLHEHRTLTVNGVVVRLGGLTQPTVSHHLKVLVKAELVARDKEGAFRHHQLAYGALHELAGLIDPGSGLKRGTDG